MSGKKKKTPAERKEQLRKFLKGNAGPLLKDTLKKVKKKNKRLDRAAAIKDAK